jgi:hypothetical protein
METKPMQSKKSYSSPKLTVYGNVAKITFGRRGGSGDAITGGAAIS